MMIAKPSPNPRSALATYRDRISRGAFICHAAFVEGKILIDKSATGSSGSMCSQRTRLTSANGARQRLAVRQLTGRLPMARISLRYHVDSGEATGACFWTAWNIVCEVALRRGNVPKSLKTRNGVRHDRERQTPQRP